MEIAFLSSSSLAWLVLLLLWWFSGDGSLFLSFFLSSLCLKLKMIGYWGRIKRHFSKAVGRFSSYLFWLKTNTVHCFKNSLASLFLTRLFSAHLHVASSACCSYRRRLNSWLNYSLPHSSLSLYTFTMVKSVREWKVLRPRASGRPQIGMYGLDGSEEGKCGPG